MAKSPPSTDSNKTPSKSASIPNAVGKTIKTLIPASLDYMDTAKDGTYPPYWLECRITTGLHVWICFEDGSALHCEYSPSREGFSCDYEPYIDIPEPDYVGEVFPLPAIFRYCIGYGVLKTALDEDSVTLLLKGGSRLRVSCEPTGLTLFHCRPCGSTLDVSMDDLKKTLSDTVRDRLYPPTEEDYVEESWISFSTVEEDDSELDEVFGNYGFRDQNGNITIEPQFLSCGSEFRSGRCPASLGRTWYRTPEGKRYYEMHWGYIDKYGKMVIPMKFRDARSFNRYGVAAVRDSYDNDWTLIDTNGDFLPGLEDLAFDECYDPDSRFFLFTYGDASNMDCNIGLYDTKERKILVPPEKLGFIDWEEDLIEVEDVDANGRFGYYIDSTGTALFPGLNQLHLEPSCRPSPSGHVVVAKEVLTPRDPEDDSSGYLLEDGGKSDRIRGYGIASVRGKIVIPLEYDYIHYAPLINAFVCRKGTDTTYLRFTGNRNEYEEIEPPKKDGVSR